MKFKSDLEERVTLYGLSLHPEKTTTVNFKGRKTIISIS